MLEQENNDVYEPYYYPSFTAYSPYSPYSSYASVGVLDAPQLQSAPVEQDMVTPPNDPLGPHGTPPAPPTPPHKRRGRGIMLLTVALILILGVGLFSGWVFSLKNSTSTTASRSQTTTTTVVSSSASSVEAQQESAISKVEPGVVELKVITSQGEQIGSGVIIDSQGDIVTNNHVVSGEQSIVVVLYNGKQESAQLIGTSSANDLAVVRITPYTGMTVVQIANSSTLVTGQEVLAIGNPLGITETATEGIVSAVNRSVTESTGTTISQAIQTDAAINPGNSGGALINLQGQLVGIPTLTAVNTETNTAANGIGFAIPSNLVKSVVQQIVQGQ